MAYPACGNLELVLSATMEGVPGYNARQPVLLSLEPFPRFGSLETWKQILIEQMVSEGFLHPPEGMIHFFDRVQRMPRLADGRYEIFVPEYDTGTFRENPLGMDFRIPETVLTLEHERAYHPCASHDRAMLAQKAAEKRYEKTLSEDVDRLGYVEKLVNFEAWERDFSSVYSTLWIRLPVPDRWDTLHDEFETMYGKEMGPYLESRERKIQELRKQGTGPKGIRAAIASDDDAFAEKHSDFFHLFLPVHLAPYIHHSLAVRRLFEEYGEILYSREFIPSYMATGHFATDHRGRVMATQGVGPDKPLTETDLHRGNQAIERLPFNQRFHDILQDRLKRKITAPKGYEQLGRWNLLSAFRLLEDGHYSSAITRAHTAFEVVLKGFLEEHGIIEKVEGLQGTYYQRKATDHKNKKPLTIRSLVGELFDQAVQRDPGYGGRGHDVFDRQIREKIISLPKKSGEMPPALSAIRHSEVHTGWGIGGTSNPELSVFACETYAEGISYILHEGWKGKDGMVRLASEEYYWLHPRLKGRVTPVPKNRSLAMLEADLETALEYLDPLEMEHLKRSVPDHSWAASLLKNKKH